jgi:hypothetical protein
LGTEAPAICGRSERYHGFNIAAAPTHGRVLGAYKAEGDRVNNYSRAFGGTPAATIRNTQTGIPFTMRLVCKGDYYGRSFALVHDSALPLVEFYDARHIPTIDAGPDDERPEQFGQFVSRYYLKTLLSGSAHEGLNLQGGVDDWTIDAAGMAAAFAVLNNWRLCA